MEGSESYESRTDAVLVVFWRWEEMVLRWHRPVGRSIASGGDKEGVTSNSRQSDSRNE